MKEKPQTRDGERDSDLATEARNKNNVSFSRAGMNNDLTINHEGQMLYQQNM